MEGTETLILLEEVLGGKIYDQKLYKSKTLSLHLMLVNSSFPVVRAAGMIATRLKQQKKIEEDNYCAFQIYIKEIISGNKPKSLEIVQHTLKNDLNNKTGKLIFCLSKLYKLYTSNLLSSFFALKLHMAQFSVSLINKHTSYCRFFLVLNNRYKVFMKHIIQNWKDNIIKKSKPLATMYRKTQIKLKTFKKILVSIKPSFEQIAFWRWKIKVREYKDVKNKIAEAIKKSEIILRYLLYKTAFSKWILYQNKRENTSFYKIGTVLSIAKHRYFSLQLLSIIKWKGAVKKYQKEEFVINIPKCIGKMNLRNSIKIKDVLVKIMRISERKYLDIKHILFTRLCFDNMLEKYFIESKKSTTSLLSYQKSLEISTNCTQLESIAKYLKSIYFIKKNFPGQVLKTWISKTSNHIKNQTTIKTYTSLNKLTKEKLYKEKYNTNTFNKSKNKSGKLRNINAIKLAFRSLMKLQKPLIVPFFHIWKNLQINEYWKSPGVYGIAKNLNKAFGENEKKISIKNQDRFLKSINIKLCSILYRALCGFIKKRVRYGIECIIQLVEAKKSSNHSKLENMVRIISNIYNKNSRKILKPNKNTTATRKKTKSILQATSNLIKPSNSQPSTSHFLHLLNHILKRTQNQILSTITNPTIKSSNPHFSYNLSSILKNPSKSQSLQIPKTLQSLSTLTNLLAKNPILSLNQSFKKWKLHKFLLPKLLNKKIISQNPISYKNSLSYWYSISIHSNKSNFVLIKKMTIATQNYINRLKQFAIFKLVMFSTFCPNRIKKFSLTSIGSLSDLKVEETEIPSFMSIEDKSFNEGKNYFSISTGANSRVTKYDMMNNDQNWALQLLVYNIKSVLLRKKMFGLTCIEMYSKNMLEFDEEREILYEEIRDLRYDKMSLLEDNAVLRMYNEELVESLEKTNNECLIMSDLVKETKLSRMVALLGKMVELPMLEVVFTLRSNNNFYMI
ncbi:hypothetical protein SteCoe_3004 [Stentor coeruleus]|uniref:Uncharacterized protein n=1 Tax=Stentor coeruleus TaxID=5963 RepID=A0A1R2CY47_9CILI|nr:hypothetical protein SteCoe_3004 [Stentor coeruleus]